MSKQVSGNGPEKLRDLLVEEQFLALAAARDATLRPELKPFVEEGSWGEMLRHPMVYAVPLMLPGYANETYEKKMKALAEARDSEDWHTVVFLHERPYRLEAFIDHCTGRDEYDDIIPLVSMPEHWELAAEVWVDSENIEQVNDDWRALFLNGEPGWGRDLWLGNEVERRMFDLLPDPIPAWRGGTVGDWSWTTNRETALFFSRRSGIAPRRALIPKADCFGYLTRRSEYELLVRLTDERRHLVYPNVSGNGAGNG